MQSLRSYEDGEEGVWSGMRRTSSEVYVDRGVCAGREGGREEEGRGRQEGGSEWGGMEPNPKVDIFGGKYLVINSVPRVSIFVTH